MNYTKPRGNTPPPAGEYQQQGQDDHRGVVIAHNMERRAQAKALLAKYTASFADIPLASGQEVLRLQNDRAGRPVFLVDVRDPAERSVSMIPGAVSAAEFEETCRSAPESVAHSIVIPYCTIGFRSGMYCRRLLRGELLKGVVPVEVRNGEGVVCWTHDVGDFAGGVRRLHCYGKEWDVAADGYATTVYSSSELVQALPLTITAWIRFFWSGVRSWVSRLFGS